MKYTVNINEKKKEISVTLADGTTGTARCCPTDRFDLQTGIELALERAKVAQINANKAREKAPAEMTTRMSVDMLAKQLEKTLHKGEIVVVVGGGDSCLTAEGKAWLAKIAGVSKNGCGCKCHEEDDYYTEDEIDKIEEDAYDDGYNDGYSDGQADGYDEAIEKSLSNEDVEEILDRVRDVLTDVIIP